MSTPASFKRWMAIEGFKSEQIISNTPLFALLWFVSVYTDLNYVQEIQNNKNNNNTKSC